MYQISQIKTLQQQVEHCLQIHPDTRNSDIKLTIAVWQTFYAGHLVDTVAGKVILVDDLYILPREDNIKRVRARLQSAGKFLPTEWEVAKKRQINRQVWEAYLRDHRQPAMEFEPEDMPDEQPWPPEDEELSVCCGAPLTEDGRCRDCYEYGRPS